MYIYTHTHTYTHHTGYMVWFSECNKHSSTWANSKHMNKEVTHLPDSTIPSCYSE